MRLTCKTANGYCDMQIATRENKLEKLGQLEDIEEEMEIELLAILNEVLKQGAWFMLPEYTGRVSEAKPDFIRHVTLGYSNQWYLEYDYFVFHLAEYGKTWALTKEELEK